jgi:DNA-binding NarL/FixJ family response regulator
MGVVVLSQYVEARYAVKLMNAGGGVGYLLKDRIGKVDDFVNVVVQVAEGGSVVDHGIVTALLDRQRAPHPLATLTAREREVLALMAEGKSNQAISESLSMSAKTVETHVGRIFLKLGLHPVPEGHRRVLAVLTYLRS